MKKLLLFQEHNGIKCNREKISEVWENTYDLEAVRKEYIAQTGIEPEHMTIVERSVPNLIE